MVDAAGAIYVIGGTSIGIYFNDVRVSTDGGDAGRTRSGGGGSEGAPRGVLRGTKGVLGGY